MKDSIKGVKFLRVNKNLLMPVPGIRVTVNVKNSMENSFPIPQKTPKIAIADI